MDVLADWWDKFATTEVGSVESFSGRETRESADHVASALRAWHEAGAASGDLAFWRERAEQFRSPKAYALVVDALLEQRSPVASMALLVQWLSQADQIPLAEEDYSFHNLALDWMQDLWDDFDDGEADGRRTPQQRWALARKFLDYLEANAEEYWEVPRFESGGRRIGRRRGGGRRGRRYLRRRLRRRDLPRQHRRRHRRRNARRRRHRRRGHRLRTRGRGRADRGAADLPRHAGPALEAGGRGFLRQRPAGRSSANRCWPAGSTRR